MASEKILNAKREVVNEIADKIKNSESVVLFSYQGLTVADMAELRSKLKEANGEVKIYKNTLVRRATDKMNLDMANVLEGPNAIIFALLCSRINLATSSVYPVTTSSTIGI